MKYSIILLCLIDAAISVVPAASAQPTNIVLILADDVGREVLGCYGGASYETPHIDGLAAGGTRFQHYYTMPVCHPTRIALLTGRYPFRLGNPEWGRFPRHAEPRTLAQILNRAGYATAVAGKWQLVLLKNDLEQPHRLGFEEYCLYGWHEGPWYYEPHIWQNGKRRTDVRDRFGPDVICDYITDFIQRNKDRPFFAFYSMELCHAETNDLAKPAPVGPHGRYDSYAEMVGKMDERVGRVIAVLEQLSLRERTLVVYTTDNGTAAHTLVDAEGNELIYAPVVSRLGERDVPGGKSTLTDWGTRVPLIVNWAGKIRPGQVSNELVDVTDILPSLAEIAGARLPDDVSLDGRSVIAPVRKVPPRDWVFAEHEGHCFVRNQHWKLYDDGRVFDMDVDEDEEHPLTTEELSIEAAVTHRDLQKALDGLGYAPRHK